MYIVGSHRGHCDKRPPVGVQHGEELPITFSEEKIQTALKNIIFHMFNILIFLKLYLTTFSCLFLKDKGQ